MERGLPTEAGKDGVVGPTLGGELTVTAPDEVDRLLVEVVQDISHDAGHLVVGERSAQLEAFDQLGMERFEVDALPDVHSHQMILAGTAADCNLILPEIGQSQTSMARLGPGGVGSPLAQRRPGAEISHEGPSRSSGPAHHEGASLAGKDSALSSSTMRSSSRPGAEPGAGRGVGADVDSVGAESSPCADAGA